MTGLRLTIEGADTAPFAAVPTINFRLAIDDRKGLPVQSIQLRTQIRIEPERRHYSLREQDLLLGLFGAPERWGETLQSFLWTHVTVPVGSFENETRIDLPVTCSYDLEVALGHYLHALGDGEIPLLFLFSGTIFRRLASGTAVEQIPWDREARFRLPVATWRHTMDTAFPDTGWLRLDRGTLDRLQAHKAQHALPTWEATIANLLDAREAAQ